MRMATIAETVRSSRYSGVARYTATRPAHVLRLMFRTLLAPRSSTSAWQAPRRTRANEAWRGVAGGSRRITSGRAGEPRGCAGEAHDIRRRRNVSDKQVCIRIASQLRALPHPREMDSTPSVRGVKRTGGCMEYLWSVTHMHAVIFLFARLIVHRCNNLLLNS